MLVAVNALRLVTGGKSYLLNLLRAIARLGKGNRYLIYSVPSSHHLFDGLPGNFEVVLGPRLLESGTLKVLWEQIWFPPILSRQRVDLLFSPANIDVLSPLFSGPSVLTIQNILLISSSLSTSMVFGEARLKRRLIYTRWLARLSVKRATKVVVPSETGRRELLRSTNVDPSKVRMIYHGGASQLFNRVASESSVTRIKRKYGISAEYILSVANLYRYKNILVLIEAYAKLCRKRDVRSQLVIAGAGSELGYYRELLDVVAQENLADKVLFIGPVPQQDLCALYKGARLYVFPSLAEIFGLTPLEAMACGVPVITANISAMPEICGNAALYFDPTDLDTLVEAIEQLLDDESLRQDMIRRGQLRARCFSWEATAREMAAIFEEACQEFKSR